MVMSNSILCVNIKYCIFLTFERLATLKIVIIKQYIKQVSLPIDNYSFLLKAQQYNIVFCFFIIHQIVAFIA